MQFQGALVREQCVEFAIVIVKKHILSDSRRSNEMAGQFQLEFGRPVVLMAQDYQGVPTYLGRRDLVQFLRNVPLDAIPWKTFTIS